MKNILALIVLTITILIFSGCMDETAKALGYEKVKTKHHYISKRDVGSWDQMTAITNYKIVKNAILLKIQICEKEKNWISNFKYRKYTEGITYSVKDQDDFLLESFSISYKLFHKKNATCFEYTGIQKLNLANDELYDLVYSIGATAAHIK